MARPAVCSSVPQFVLCDSLLMSSEKDKLSRSLLPPSHPALAAPQRCLREVRSKTKQKLKKKKKRKKSPGGGVPRKEGKAVRGGEGWGEREGGKREGKQARELSKLHSTSARPGGAGIARLRPPRPGCHRRLSVLFPSDGRPPSLEFCPGGGDLGSGLGNRELQAFSSGVAGVESHLSPGLEHRAGELASRRRASPGLGHPPAFSVTQVQDNSKVCRTQSGKEGAKGWESRAGCRGAELWITLFQLPFPSRLPLGV